MVKVFKLPVCLFIINICFMELKDFLPLIIIIGSVVFSFLRKKKQGTQADEPESEKSIWETLLGDDDETPEMQHRSPQEAPMDEDDAWWGKEESVVEITEEKRAAGPEFTPQTVEVADEGVPSVAHKPQKDSPIYEHDITTKKRSRLKPDFSNKQAIKQGVIFSEVFNRKIY